MEKIISINEYRQTYPDAVNLIIKHKFKMTDEILKGYVFPKNIVSFNIGKEESSIITTDMKLLK